MMASSQHVSELLRSLKKYVYALPKIIDPVLGPYLTGHMLTSLPQHHIGSSTLVYIQI